LQNLFPPKGSLAKLMTNKRKKNGERKAKEVERRESKR